MARNRQRAKQRQAERRAARLGGDSPSPETAEEREELEEEVELYTGAPPQDTGFSDTVVEHEPPAPDFATDDEDLEEAVDDYEEEVAPEKRRRRDGAHAEHHERHHRNRLIAFLIAVWAELQRVEWPNRQTLTLLTGVVLVFVIIMGAYLGLLDAIFNKLINKIL
jgi:preprotein translocase subunit SecE